MKKSPPHYVKGSIQPIDVIEDWKLDFRLASALKYICRFPYKGSPRQDLEKAVWYINRYIEKELPKAAKELPKVAKELQHDKRDHKTKVRRGGKSSGPNSGGD